MSKTNKIKMPIITGNIIKLLQNKVTLLYKNKYFHSNSPKYKNITLVLQYLFHKVLLSHKKVYKNIFVPYYSNLWQ